MTRLLLPSLCNFLTSQLPKSYTAAPIPIPFHILIVVTMISGNVSYLHVQLDYFAMIVM